MLTLHLRRICADIPQIAVETCRARALTADTPTLESIGFASEDQGIAHHTIEGDMYNEAGDSVPASNDELRPTAKASTPATKTLTSMAARRAARPSKPPAGSQLPLSKTPARPPSPQRSPPPTPSRVPSTRPSPCRSTPLPPSRVPSCAPSPCPSPCQSPPPASQRALSRVSSQLAPSVSAIPPKSPLESNIACCGSQVKTTLPDEGGDASQRALKESEPSRKDARTKKRKADIDEASDRPRKKGMNNDPKAFHIVTQIQVRRTMARVKNHLWKAERCSPHLQAL